MSFSELNNGISLVINGCKDCPLKGYHFEISNNMVCYLTDKDIDLKVLKDMKE